MFKSPPLNEPNCDLNIDEKYISSLKAFQKDCQDQFFKVITLTSNSILAHPSSTESGLSNSILEERGILTLGVQQQQLRFAKDLRAK